MTDEPISGWLICREKGYFVDDVTGSCFDCGKRVQHRPHAAPPGAGIKKLCIRCGVKRFSAEPEPPQFVLTEKSIQELKDFSKAKEN